MIMGYDIDILSIILSLIAIIMACNVFTNLSYLKKQINQIQTQLTELNKKIYPSEISEKKEITDTAEIANTAIPEPKISSESIVHTPIELENNSLQTNTDNQPIIGKTPSLSLKESEIIISLNDEIPPKQQSMHQQGFNSQEKQYLDFINYFITWLFKGNVVAKVAIIILFFGLSYLFKYSIDHGLLSPEIRILGAFVLGIVLLTFGWRLRQKKQLYALILQGGAIGDLYLTIYAAFKLYQLIPSTFAYILLLVICGTSVLFAVLQRAISLAILASVGGYLAPILLSTNSGNHIALFSYYLMISSSFLIIAHWQSWRILNLIGFAFTCIVSLIWGYNNFRPEFYAECQFFILANMLIYGVLAVLLSVRYANKESNQNIIDLILLIGTSLLAFLLQYAITKQWEFGPAFSALGFGLFYLTGSYIILRRYPLFTKTVSLYGLAIGLSFSNLTVALAFDPQWIALIWLFEGSALSWAMLTQKQPRLAWCGALITLLGFFSGNIYLSSYLENSPYIIAFGCISIYMLFNACLWHYYQPLDFSTKIIKLLFITLAGITWIIWIVSSIMRINEITAKLQAITLCFMISTWLWYIIGQKINWRILNNAVIILWPILFISRLTIIRFIFDDTVLNSSLWYLFWPIAFLNAYFYLYLSVKRNIALPKWLLLALHISLFWITLDWLFDGIELLFILLPMGLATVEFSVLLATNSSIVLLFYMLVKRRIITTPYLAKTYWLIGLTPIILYLVYQLLIGIFMNGKINNWYYIPFINPLEISAIFALMMLGVWLKLAENHLRINSQSTNMANLSASLPNIILILLTLLTFLWANSLVLRCLSQWFNIDWSFYFLWHSNIVQATLSLIWTLIAVALVTTGHRYSNRKLWYTGVFIQLIVVIKLIFVDSVELDGLLRAFAFIGVALLMLLIGYLAPVPPKIKQLSNEE